MKSSSSTGTIWWLRKDLRLHDNPALQAAVARGAPLYPVYIFSPHDEDPWPMGGASRWWLHESLARLGEDLKSRFNSRLLLRKGPSLPALEKLLKETGADAVLWNRRYEAHAIACDTEIKSTLLGRGLTCESFNAALLREPWELRKKDNTPYKVYTPYSKAALALPSPALPTPAPVKLPLPTNWPYSLELDELELKPKIAWDHGLAETWHPGERAALKQLDQLTSGGLKSYAEKRNIPGDAHSTSRLSPYLHFGEISPRLIWQKLNEKSLLSRTKASAEDQRIYLNEILWREFAHHLFFYFPGMDQEPLHKEFKRFPWRTDAVGLRAWQRGQTGYPIVDAGMRQLWQTGWMHNRVRMIVGSFLVKDLLIDWQQGARWFWDTLVDADLAQNSFNWQWIGGCGADASPYFRVFNPILQGEKFDPDGSYVRRWVPELAALPNRLLHKPWEAGENFLKLAGVDLGVTYPHPIVEHDGARLRALAALKSLKT